MSAAREGSGFSGGGVVMSTWFVLLLIPESELSRPAAEAAAATSRGRPRGLSVSL